MAEIRTKKWNDPPSPDDGTRIFVARYWPRGLRKGEEPWDEWLIQLAPSRELHAAWYGKRGLGPISLDEYTKQYRQEMESQQEAIGRLARRLLNGETLTLLCYCADPTKCHRTLLKSMIEKAAEALSGQ